MFSVLGHMGEYKDGYLMWDLLQAVQGSYVIQSVYGWRQASVKAEDLTTARKAIMKSQSICFIWVG